MVATVQLIEKNGAGATVTDKTSGTIRFKTADNSTVDTNNPMVVPAASSNFSYQKWCILNCTVAPSTQITNVRWYTSGSNPFGTGVNLWWKAVTAYATPTQPASTTGYTNGFTYTSGAPLTTGSGTYTGTGQFGDHLVMMLEVQSTAAAGALTAATLTLSWDEI